MQPETLHDTLQPCPTPDRAYAVVSSTWSTMSRTRAQHRNGSGCVSPEPGLRWDGPLPSIVTDPARCGVDPFGMGADDTQYRWVVGRSAATLCQQGESP